MASTGGRRIVEGDASRTSRASIFAALPCGGKSDWNSEKRFPTLVGVIGDATEEIYDRVEHTFFLPIQRIRTLTYVEYDLWIYATSYRLFAEMQDRDGNVCNGRVFRLTVSLSSIDDDSYQRVTRCTIARRINYIQEVSMRANSISL